MGGGSLSQFLSFGAFISQPRLFDLLLRLVDKSFVIAEQRGGEQRYRMLETIRCYAAEKLAEAGEEAHMIERHRAWYLDVAARAEQEIKGPGAAMWYAWLDADLDNFRAVLRRCDERAEAADAALRLCTLLERFWSVRGHWGEGRRCFERAFEAAPDAPAELRAAALNRAGNLAANLGDVDQAIAFYEESLALRRAGDDRRAIANTVHNLAIVVYDAGDFARAEALYDESHAIYRELGDRQGVAASLLSLGVLAVHQRDYGRAAAVTEECLAIFRALGEQRSVGLALMNLGQIACLRRDFETARAFADESIAVANALGFKVLAATATEVLGEIALERGDLSLARALLCDTLRQQQDLGNRGGIAASLNRLACVAAASGDAARAVRLAGAAARIQATTGTPPSALERDLLERYLAPARATLGADATEHAVQWAAETESDAAIGFALENTSAGDPAP
jgi:tetratricopeptide (TPR) repeat protein